MTNLRIPAVGLILFLTSCGQASAIEGTWGLDSMVVDGQPQTLPPEFDTLQYGDVAAWIRFDSGGNVNGELPCNAFMGAYEFDESMIQWEVVKDSGLCLEPEGVMEAEEPMTTLIWTPQVEVALGEDETTMELSGGGVVMSFSRLEN